MKRRGFSHFVYVIVALVAVLFLLLIGSAFASEIVDGAADFVSRALNLPFLVKPSSGEISFAVLDQEGNPVDEQELPWDPELIKKHPPILGFAYVSGLSEYDVAGGLYISRLDIDPSNNPCSDNCDGKVWYATSMASVGKEGAWAMMRGFGATSPTAIQEQYFYIGLALSKDFYDKYHGNIKQISVAVEGGPGLRDRSFHFILYGDGVGEGPWLSDMCQENPDDRNVIVCALQSSKETKANANRGTTYLPEVTVGRKEAKYVLKENGIEMTYDKGGDEVKYVLQLPSPKPHSFYEFYPVPNLECCVIGGDEDWRGYKPWYKMGIWYSGYKRWYTICDSSSKRYIVKKFHGPKDIKKKCEGGG